MTTIIEMAREAGFVEYELEDYTQSGYDIRYERFAELVRADERDRNTQLLYQMHERAADMHNYYKHAAIEINRKARGNT